MEFDDFKNTWQEMSRQVKEKQNFNLKIIDRMSNQKIHSSLRGIFLPEIFGSIICLGSAIFIVFNFGKLNTTPTEICGVASIILFALLPLLSLWSVSTLYHVGNISRTYAETLKDFTVRKIKFYRLQKINFTLSYLLLGVLLILLPKLFGKKEFTNDQYFWVLLLGSLGYIVLAFFSKWVFKSYIKKIRQTEELLNELVSL
jgi:hypothetical protein